MTAKEKAKELLNKFSKSVNTITNTPLKKCALIAVDEIIIEITDNYDSLHAIGQALYWQQVKTEIEKL